MGARAGRGLMSGALLAVAAAAGAAEPAGAIAFNRDIRPILSDHCFPCHGPDAAHRQADLRLDLREAAVAEAIVPGRPDSSPLVARIIATDPDTVMPPPGAHKPLDERQRKLLARWIEAGAGYQKHWAYEPPVRPEVPAGRNGIDFLVERRLAALGLEPVGEADRRTLVRRLSIDLTGLPPTPAEVDAFLADPAPDAYERLVERLLLSPHHGERMAQGWLDAVRFADTIGYHSDTPRNVWPYRDWVIRAFNANKPFDDFTIEQLAGDLLPEADQETRIGSAFNRLLLTTEEGGAQAKDYEARMLTDRVRAVGSVWLGQTTGCAQCHDHKFDPFTSRDFYGLGAFFADVNEPAIGKREEGMIVASPEERGRLDELEAAVVAAQSGFDAIVPQLDAAQAQWEADVVAYAVTLPELRPDAPADEAAKKRATQVSAALAKESLARTPAETQAIRDHFRGRVTRLFAPQRDALAAATRSRDEFRTRLPKCLVSVPVPPRTVRILPRGNWMDESGEVVEPALPAFLVGESAPATAAGRRLTRLDLARWLVSPDNPLTPRVTMNRLWKQFFGTGISRVLDDFGGQGEPPVNPELLDWLACEFRDGGWDLRRMVRLIVTSATYRRSSLASPRLIEADPLNRELARQSAWRLEAEMVRDAALATAGLLVREIGGPSVRPYQPDGYWENLNFPKRTYPADPAPGQYRRGLYTWWQRSFLHPSLLAFDAPSREECCAERTRSNIPQQALVLLNDPTYVEAARAFAVQILREGGESDEQRVAWAWRQALQRLPRVEEVEIVVPVLRQHRADYAHDSAAAAALAGVGLSARPTDLEPAEVAAWTHLARILLNLHETITRN